MPDKGFFGSLFDVSFTSFATSRIIKVLYILTIVVIFLYAVIWVIASFAADPGLGAASLFIGAPIFVLLSLMWTRLLFELAIAVLRIMENTNAMVGGGGVPGVPSPAPAGFGGGPQPGALGTAPPPTAQPAAPRPAAQPAAPPVGGGPGQAPGWYPDPQGKARVRYWDGSSWTDHTAE
jgi:hypothetical protein